MTIHEFKSSLQQSTAPPQTNELLRAMWHEAKGDWNTAHSIAQDINTSNGSWVHAYLHRVEGDESNARYWYARAGKNFPG